MPYFCVECSCFVAGPLATCGNCGREHTNFMGRAMEEPKRKRRRRTPGRLFP